MLSLRQEFHAAVAAGPPRAHPHGRQALRVRRLQQDLQPEELAGPARQG